MKYPVYSYRDKKVGFGAPTVDVNEVSAVRGFKYAVSQPGLMGFVPEDYDLYQIGEFDTDSGMLIALDVPKFVISGSSCVGG